MSTARNIRFSYLYRDAGNNKLFGDVILANPAGLSCADIECRIRTHLISSEFFEPEQWGIPPLRFDRWDIDLDHTWHEFESVEPTDEPVTHEKTAEDFWSAILLPEYGQKR